MRALGSFWDRERGEELRGTGGERAAALARCAIGAAQPRLGIPGLGALALSRAYPTATAPPPTPTLHPRPGHAAALRARAIPGRNPPRRPTRARSTVGACAARAPPRPSPRPAHLRESARP